MLALGIHIDEQRLVAHGRKCASAMNCETGLTDTAFLLNESYPFHSFT